MMRCPHCKQQGKAYYISGSGTASNIWGCKGCGKKFRTQVKRPEPPLRWDEAREVLPDSDGRDA